MNAFEIKSADPSAQKQGDRLWSYSTLIGKLKSEQHECHYKPICNPLTAKNMFNH
jgi:hypothetical protein